MISNTQTGTYNWAANVCRQNGAPILPAWYGEPFLAATDPYLFDLVPQVDRGPFVVCSIAGLPFDDATPAIQSTIMIKSGSRDICFAPINVVSVSNPLSPEQDMGTNLPQPIVVWPGSSLYLRNNSGGAAPAFSGPIVHGFHTSERGGRIIARVGELWSFPVHFDFTVTPTQSLDQVMEPGTSEIIGITEDVNNAGATMTSLQISVRGVDLMFGNTRMTDVGAPTGWMHAGHRLFAKVKGGDTMRLRAVQPAGTGVLSMTVLCRRTYREGSLC